MASLVLLVHIIGTLLFLLLWFCPGTTLGGRTLTASARFVNFDEPQVTFLDTTGENAIRGNRHSWLKDVPYDLRVRDRKSKGPPYSMKLEWKLKTKDEWSAFVYDPLADYMDATREIGKDGIAIHYHTIWRYRSDTNTITYEIELDGREKHSAHFCYLGETPPDLATNITHTQPLAPCSAYDTELHSDPFPTAVVNHSKNCLWMAVDYEDEEPNAKSNVGDVIWSVTRGIVNPGERRMRRAFWSSSLYRNTSSSTALKLRFPFAETGTDDVDGGYKIKSYSVDIGYDTSRKEADEKEKKDVHGVEVIVDDWEKKASRKEKEKAGIYVSWFITPKKLGTPPIARCYYHRQPKCFD